MPYLQLDVSHRYSIEVKRPLAQRLGNIYAEVMQTASNEVTIAFRELEEGSLWRCGVGEPTTAAVLMCDIRRGRPAEQRARLTHKLAMRLQLLRGEPMSGSQEMTDRSQQAHRNGTDRGHAKSGPSRSM